MLDRRFLRIKAFKAIYSYAENPSMELRDVQAQLEKSCEATRNLYLFLLASIPALTSEARSRIDAARRKFNPTAEELNPNLKFVENRICPILERDPDFTKIISKKKLSWEQYDVFLRHLYDSVRSKDYYQDYMAAPLSSLKDDASLFAKIFEQEFLFNDELDEILEDLSIWWNDDLADAVKQCLRTLQSMGDENRWDLPGLFYEGVEGNSDGISDRDFVNKLLRTAYCRYSDYYEKIAASVPKWDKNRLFTTDVALIATGLAEADTFPTIPSQVTINEYVELSKYYSTPKSRSFVNGLLDTIIKSNDKQ